MGDNINNAAMTLYFIFFKLIFNPLKNLAIAKQHPTLANSAGCILTNPKSSHDLAPLTSIPQNKTPIKINKDRIYIK